jgi:uncharacterized protein (DUF983 family)
LISIPRVALTHCCPACGKGSLYAGLLKVAPSCTSCGQSFGGEDSGDGPAFFVILVVGFLVTAGAGIVEVLIGLPLWLHALIWTPVTLLLSIWLLRVSKSGLLAWQYQVAHLGEDPPS